MGRLRQIERLDQLVAHEKTLQLVSASQVRAIGDAAVARDRVAHCHAACSNVLRRAWDGTNARSIIFIWMYCFKSVILSLGF